jgi:hypothetical protein
MLESVLLAHLKAHENQLGLGFFPRKNGESKMRLTKSFQENNRAYTNKAYEALRAIIKKSIVGTLVLAGLSGCSTLSTPVPKGYSGPVATIKDSVNPISESKADFFYVSEIDGKRIEDSRLRTLRTNQGRGFHMIPLAIERDVPTQSSILTLVGRTEYAAPILALTNTVYQVTGKITFSPEADKSYIVRGELGEDRSAVWIEDEATGKKVGEKIEVIGSAKLGVFEK